MRNKYRKLVYKDTGCVVRKMRDLPRGTRSCNASHFDAASKIFFKETQSSLQKHFASRCHLRTPRGRMPARSSIPFFFLFSSFSSSFELSSSLIPISLPRQREAIYFVRVRGETRARASRRNRGEGVSVGIIISRLECRCSHTEIIYNTYTHTTYIIYMYIYVRAVPTLDAAPFVRG